MEENALLKTRVRELEEENRSLREKPQGIFETMQSDEKKLCFYTGLPDLAAFVLVLRLAMLAGFTKFKTLSESDTLLIILMKLRLGTTNMDLAYRFGVNARYVSTILSTRLTFVASVAKKLICWPSQGAIRANMPTCFRACGRDIRHTRVILDCFDIFTERPKGLAARAQLWSNYKSHSTVKVLIGISPAGAVTYVSEVWGGRASDKQITLDGKLLDLLDPYDVVMADRGFLVADELAAMSVRVVTPHFTKGKQQMSRREVQESRRLSRVRIHVERVIGRIRRNYRVLGGVIPIGLIPQVNNIVTICCGLINLHRSVV